ncbi:MAG: DUF6488 family protein [Gammaproteobacteria bacterium]|nr:DUF6488 family protein [Gammaproteobacteria bacterium]
MRIQALVLSLMLSLLPVAVWAHGAGGSHDPVTQSQAEQAAIEGVAFLANQGRIDSSWKAANVVKTEKKKFGESTEWVVSFKNDKISDSTKQILYIFLTLGGEVVGANHTGN